MWAADGCIKQLLILSAIGLLTGWLAKKHAKQLKLNEHLILSFLVIFYRDIDKKGFIFSALAIFYDSVEKCQKTSKAITDGPRIL